MVLPRAVLLGVPRAARMELIASNRVVASRGEVLSRGQTESWTPICPGDRPSRGEGICSRCSLRAWRCQPRDPPRA